MKRHLVMLAVVAVVALGLLAVTPQAAQAQAPGSSGVVVTPGFPTYYFTPPVVYGWNPLWRLPYYYYPGYVWPGYYSSVLPQPYYSTYVPAYNLPALRMGAHNYWARSAYLPYQSSYYYNTYNAYRPAVYFNGY